MILDKIFPSRNDRQIKKYKVIVAQINALESSIEKLTNEELKAKTAEFKTRLTDGAKLDDILVEAFACVREASKRTLGQRHHDVQLIGGMVLHSGNIAEMKTGEGKTLMATLAAYLNALDGKGVHIVTVNDYLARRDAAWMGKVFHSLGITTSVINHTDSFMFDPSHVTPEQDQTEEEQGAFKVVYEFLKPISRQEAYKADITYGTNHYFGFDYLFDNIEHDPTKVRQREFNFAIVDEVDSILIDEARTPLIISMPGEESGTLYETFAKIARKLEPEKHYTVDEKFRAIQLTQEGIDLAEKELGIGNIYSEGGIAYVHHLETAVRAKALFNNNVEYLVKEGEILLIDQSTGRLQPGRRLSEGLHQAIEAKENVTIQKETKTAASITYQNLFRLYPKLAGMTGTGATSKEEFIKVYNLDVIVVPTHLPIARIDHNDLVFKSELGKFKAIARKIKELHKKGQPVLVGTISIEKNQLLADYLKMEGVPFQLLNAKPEFAEKEGQIVAQAGKKGAVTIATNMAGRGVDIKLGGVPSTPAEVEEIKALGGLFVLGTERHEARRIDNQLRGRSGRQGDPGATQFFVSLEDELMRIFATDLVKRAMDYAGLNDDQPIESKLVSRSLETAQSKKEGLFFDQRKHVLEFDDVLNQQRKVVYERRRALLFADKARIEERLTDALSVATEAERLALDEKRKTLGDDTFLSIARSVILQSIDTFWMQHLELMDYLRGSVNLRAYGQRDPLVEYKKEGLRYFKEMQLATNDQVIKAMLTINIDIGLGRNESGVVEARQDVSGVVDTTAKVVSRKQYEGEVGRNDPCPCGSGKKYKKCHGA